ncbi:MAG: alpha/beta hydrolase [Henriciella sp.]|nr:alpha/beta hydrolase [Henriciella sp.]
MIFSGRTFNAFPFIAALIVTACAGALPSAEGARTQPVLAGSQLDRLSDISIDALRNRQYGQGELAMIAPIDRTCTSQEHSGERPRQATRLMARYQSEGQSLYARIDVPFEPPPPQGYPVMVFAHGWVGSENAPDWHFGCTLESSYGDVYGNVINAWAEAGYVVLVPGYRGHGTVKGVPAEGHSDMLAWDNGAYLMPSFYAVDVLNLIAASQSVESINVLDEHGAPRTIRLDPSRYFINGHSQGGDVTLTVLAATGEGAQSEIEFAGGSIWAGNIAARFEQLATFDAMSTSPEAFLAGDGTWTGTAIGSDGTANANFIFGFPPDWIGSPHPEDWTWQSETFSRPRIEGALRAKAIDMYETLNEQVGEFENLSWEVDTTDAGQAFVSHDPRLIEIMSRIGGADAAEFLTEPLHLHFSDRDYYSLPIWNFDLCERANAAGGACQTFEYFGNTHSLGVSEHDWFSPPGSQAGHAAFINHDLCRFNAAPQSEKAVHCNVQDNR